MAIVKSSPSELAIHGGGPPAFASKLPVFTANVGNGQRFAGLAERMFVAEEAPGRLAEEFEGVLCEWLGVRNVVGFSSLPAAMRCVERSVKIKGKVFAPAFGSGAFSLEERPVDVDCETATYGMSPAKLAVELRDDASAVFAVHPLGRPCMIEELQDLCDEWSVPLFLYGHQALGCSFQGARLGTFGRAEIFDLGRDQLVHAMDATVVATDDDLLAHRLRRVRSERVERIDQSIGDAAAAMGIANLEAAPDFVKSNRARSERYRELLLTVPGIKFVRHEAGSTYQSIAIEVDPSLAGLSRDALHDVLVAENVGTDKPLHDNRPLTPTPQRSAPATVASRLASSLLQLPNGPAATEEAIEAVCKLVELAIIRSLESPDPIRLAA
ncbi:MAG: DegT/DnrJ/EryC1/StrS family aminotransferase [Fimbriimonadales bacterium]